MTTSSLNDIANTAKGSKRDHKEVITFTLAMARLIFENFCYPVDYVRPCFDKIKCKANCQQLIHCKFKSLHRE